MKKCPNCQKEYSDVTLFCNDCGVRLDPVSNVEGKKSKKKKLWVFALLMVVIVLAISLFFIFRPKARKIVLTMDSFKDMTEDEIRDLLGKPDYVSETTLRWGDSRGKSNNDGSMIRGENVIFENLDAIDRDKSSGYFVSLYDTKICGISYDKTDHGIFLYFEFEYTDEYLKYSSERRSSEDKTSVYEGDYYKKGYVTTNG